MILLIWFTILLDGFLLNIYQSYNKRNSWMLTIQNWRFFGKCKSSNISTSDSLKRLKWLDQFKFGVVWKYQNKLCFDSTGQLLLRYEVLHITIFVCHIWSSLQSPLYVYFYWNKMYSILMILITVWSTPYMYSCLCHWSTPFVSFFVPFGVLLN